MHQFIDGKYREGRGEEAKQINPATGEVAGTIRYATAEDVGEAVAAAKRAFSAWSRLAPVERSTGLLKLAAELERRADQLAEVETAETGKSIRLASGFDVPGSIDNTAFFAGAARQLQGLAAGEYGAGGTSMVRREAIGVVGSIAPWNYPLQMAAWKILPAIAAGNTIVLKPSELTPGTSLLFAAAARDAGIPDGVVNIVTGTGPEVGEALVAHPDVAMTSFTGSTVVGRRIMELASRSAKRVHLELGGKAPFLVFDDADLEAAAHGAVAGAIINGGQDCTAATRAYVQRPLFDAFTARVAELMDQVIVGDPCDTNTDLGSLITHVHRDRVAGFVERARAAGARILAGGSAPGGSLAGGAYYRPTLVVGAAQESEIVQEEVFGPVLTVLPFDSDDEAIALANDTAYGLAASAWTRDLDRSLRASAELQAGCVWINEHIPIVSEMPHGGYKASGFGKDMSAYSFEEYTNIKHVMLGRDRTAHKEWQDTIFRLR
ncbi:gamma-aminobutyraldehyde dehydrogenase [Arthrobacter crystallopoietes BAB-32]|uniref:Gamma-aminobutyraldehyde dehydrogenase n=1 Tax=Arthrobacter crystallopoietes BAB-32 TaxID=1246476 RepID=N1V5E6_9MICC|nr:gamma-aminobutyraldehyde dehydrogenase [Arthrobacter crystallopoietes]EMY35234.1 gamma-aminobutyraldehyde dehydrogenase [Arthrobacter crystallopoietes BAB-32]